MSTPVGAPATVFIPEQYLTHKEFLIEVVGYGWGIEIHAADLPEAIRSGRVAKEVLPFGMVAIIHETAIKED